MNGPLPEVQLPIFSSARASTTYERDCLCVLFAQILPPPHHCNKGQEHKDYQMESITLYGIPSSSHHAEFDESVEKRSGGDSMREPFNGKRHGRKGPGIPADQKQRIRGESDNFHIPFLAAEE